MKPALPIAFGLVLGVIAWWPNIASTVFASSYPRPRFEVIYRQRMENLEMPFSTDFSVIHDKESGQEIVCASSTDHDNNACWPTGSSWTK